MRILRALVDSYKVQVFFIEPLKHECVCVRERVCVYIYVCVCVRAALDCRVVPGAHEGYLRFDTSAPSEPPLVGLQQTKW